MKAVVQRVTRAEVRSAGERVGQIGTGFVVLLGVARSDGEAEALQLADKIFKLRIFDDADGRMNMPIDSVPGARILLVSQFTLLGTVRKGNRPSYLAAAPPEHAARLYEHVTARLRELGLGVETGIFRTNMEVELVNDGPVTLLLDTNDWAPHGVSP
ncbi:MAG: D-aminoacyl-tRNA deacylase [Kiritimatiellae bacterium]|nr:D-aminoacyl-tRNA deacylase [Kiritimatiellia bacterium]MDY0149067.1 D-aminoacyl-tRNA deacylase [Kiritimatiellia bacterium]